MDNSAQDIDFLRHLNAALQEQPVFRDLFAATQQCIDTTISEQLQQLRHIRSPTVYHRGEYINTPDGRGKIGHIRRILNDDGTYNSDIYVTLVDGTTKVVRRTLQDRQVLIDSAKNLGFDYFSDTLSDADYERIIKYIMSFWNKSGSPEFIKFIGFAKEADLSLQQLWSLDRDDDNDAYTVLEPRNLRMQSVTEGGNYYPTSHRQITYNVLNNPVLDLADIVQLFYLFAPIHLVLHRLLGYIDADNIRLRTVVVPHGLTLSESANLQWSPQATTRDAIHIGAPHLCLISSATLIL